MLPNAHAKPQKNLPNTIVYTHRTTSTVTNGVMAIACSFPIWVKMYFTPENAVVKTEGINKKNNICMAILK